MPKLNQGPLPEKTAIYIRVSTQFQIDKDSLQVQRRDLIAYSELVLGIKDYEIFEDPGYSGKNTDRPAYQAMLSRLRSGEFSHLLVWKIDRISRNLLDFAEMYAELKRIGVTFVSKNEQFDTSTAIGEAMLKIILVFAELERQMTAERVTAVMLSRANNGQWNGGRVPYGYNWDKDSKTFSINEQEANVIRLIYDLYEEKQSLLIVCQYLNSHGYTTKLGNAWSPVSVCSILKNVFYMGTYRYNVHPDGKRNKIKPSEEWIDIENHHPALIDDVRFNRFQFLLKRNQRKGHKEGDTYTRKVVHIFAGLITCGNCGANMTATQDKRRADGWRPSMYGCSSRRKSLKRCSNKYVNDAALAPFMFSLIASILKARGSIKQTSTTDELEKLILPSLPSVKRIENLDNLLQVIKSGDSGIEYSPSLSSTLPDETATEIENLKTRRRRSETALQRLQSLYLYGEGGIPEKDYLTERKKIISDIETIEKRLNLIGADLDQISAREFSDKASYFLMVEKLLDFRPGSAEKIIRSIEPEIPKSFFNQVLSKIVITNGKVSEVYFKNQISIRFIYE